MAEGRARHGPEPGRRLLQRCRGQLHLHRNLAVGHLHRDGRGGGRIPHGHRRDEPGDPLSVRRGGADRGHPAAGPDRGRERRGQLRRGRGRDPDGRQRGLDLHRGRGGRRHRRLCRGAEWTGVPRPVPGRADQPLRGRQRPDHLFRLGRIRPAGLCRVPGGQPDRIHLRRPGQCHPAAAGVGGRPRRRDRHAVELSLDLRIP